MKELLIQDSRLRQRVKQNLILTLIAAGIAVGAPLWYQEWPSLDGASLPATLPFFFGPIALVLAALTIWGALRLRKSGGARLEYHPMTGSLTGHVRLNRLPEPLPDFSVTLLCYTRKYSDHADDHSDGSASSWRVTWSNTVEVAAASIRANNGIALAIALPPANHAGKFSNRRWELQVKAPLKGIDFYQVFEPRMGNR